MDRAIWWIRRDLRLSDNQALAEALRQTNTVIPVFILDPGLLSSDFVGPARLAFLFDGLRALETSLLERGSRLILRQGDPFEVLSTLCRDNQVEGIFAEEDYSPYAVQRDEKIALSLPLQLVNGVNVYHPQMLCKANGEPYTVFTPFSRLWRSLPVVASPLPAPDSLPTVPELKSLEIPTQPSHPAENTFRAGEQEAQKRLSSFTDLQIFEYANTRNRMDIWKVPRNYPPICGWVCSPQGKQPGLPGRQWIPLRPCLPVKVLKPS